MFIAGIVFPSGIRSTEALVTGFHLNAKGTLYLQATMATSYSRPFLDSPHTKAPFLNIHQYPLKLEPNNPNRAVTDREVRVSSLKAWKDDAKSGAAKMSFSRDTARIWNTASSTIKNAVSLYTAKIEIKKFCCQLPL